MNLSKAASVLLKLCRQVGTRKIQDADEAPTASRITAILSYSKGFACSMGPGTVCLFEKTEDSYRKSREIKVKAYA